MGLIDLTGRTVNKLTVIKRVENVKRQPAWLCKCECGGEIRVLGHTLRSQDIADCGCGSRERRAAVRRTHGMTNTPEFKIWSLIKERCLKPNCKAWKWYGGKGITLCDRWLKFENFYADMGPRPSEKHSVDRVDNTRGYSPDNCRWATDIQQANNRTNNVLITREGVTQTMKQWAQQLGIPYAVVKARRLSGVPDSELFAPSPRREYNRRIEYKGEQRTIKQWAQVLNLPYKIVWDNICLKHINPDGSNR